MRGTVFYLLYGCLYGLNNSFYFIADSLKNVEHLCKKLNDKENTILTLEEINRKLWDENHRLRLTLVNQEDLRNNIKWLKENIGRIEEYDSL